MTLVTGLVCEFNNEKCVLMCADKAVTVSNRVLESPKIEQIGNYKILIGGAGYLSDIQQFNLKFTKLLDEFFKGEMKKYKKILSDPLQFMLVEKNILRKEFPPIRSEILIGVTDRYQTKLYRVANGQNVIEINDFVAIGSGADIHGLFMLSSVYAVEPQKTLTLDEATRLAAAVNILVSRLTTDVSSNFDCFALCKGKIGTLTRESKAKLVNDANIIAYSWLFLLREIFLLDQELDFIVEGNPEALLKEMNKKEKVREKKTVLIIDDNYEKQRTIYAPVEKFLKELGLEIINIKSRKEFEKEYKRLIDRIKFIILDRRIEHRNTTDILKEINKSEAKIPVVLLARALKEQDVKHFLQIGVSLHISKEEMERDPQKVQQLISGLISKEKYVWEWK